eukprot:jgi/Ulvmu1/9166/UM005_0264.1
MSDSPPPPSVERSTDNTPHQINEIVQKCRQACESYQSFSDDLTGLMQQQDDVFRQHEDLLEQAYGELRDVAELCCEAQELLAGHVQACCTKLQRVKALGQDIQALKADVARLHSLMKALVKQRALG